jgi:Holliday junction resolvase
VKQTKAAGSAFERRVRQHFRQRGFEAFKTSDSAIVDVVAMKARPVIGAIPPIIESPTDLAVSLVYFIECKANRNGGPYSNFRGPERQALIEAADRAGAIPLLAYRQPGGELRLIGLEEWPNHKEAA